MENVGGIQYTVVADTGQLLKAEQDALKSASNIGKSLKGLGKSSSHVDKVSESVKNLGDEAEKSGFKLSKIQASILGLATIATASSIAKMADDYRAMGERVLGASESIEEFESVQARLLESANKTFRPLAEAQELFISTSGNIRDYGYSLEEALDITDSMSYGFVRNAASADKAQSAIRAYDASLSTGKVNAMQWLSISGAIDTLAIDMGKSMGLTAREIDELGFSSQITAQMLNDALLNSFKANKDGADVMANTIDDAFVSMKNNLSVYVGELNKATGATDIVAKSIIYLSENISTIATLMGVAGAGAAARYFTQMGMLTVGKMKDAQATRASIAEELRLAQANVAAAKTEVARTASLVAKGASHVKNKAAIEAETIAVARLDAAQKAATVTTRTFLSVLGGPAGIVGLLFAGVTAFGLFASSASDARVSINELHKPIEELTEKIKDMGAAQREAFLVKYKNEHQEAVKKMGEAYDELESIMKLSLDKQRGFNFDLNKSWADLSNEISQRFAEAKRDGLDLSSFLARISEQYKIPQDVIDTWVEQNGVVADSSELVKKAAENYDLLQGAARGAAKAISEAGEAARKQAEINAGATKDIESYTKSLQSQFNTMEDGGSKVKELTRFYDEQAAKGAVLTDEQIKQKEANFALAQSIDNERESRKNANKEIANSSQVLQDLQREMYLATLSGKELAIARVEQRLNEFASEQEVQAVRNLASALYDLNEAKKFGQTKEEQDKHIEGDVGNLSGGLFDQQVERYTREAELEQERYADQLARLQQARELQLQTEDEFNQKEYDLKQKHDERMKRITIASNQAAMQSISSTFDAIAGIYAGAEGEQSRTYKAMFIASKAFSLAQTMLALPTAIAEAMKLPFPLNYAAAAAAGAQVATQIASVRSVSFGGGRQYGGSVSADKMYRVNETGQPEIFNAGGGKQYFMPNTRGEVIPANKAFGNAQGDIQSNSVVVHQSIHIEAGANIDENMIAMLKYEMQQEAEEIAQKVSINSMTEQKKHGGLLRG